LLPAKDMPFFLFPSFPEKRKKIPQKAAAGGKKKLIGHIDPSARLRSGTQNPTPHNTKTHPNFSEKLFPTIGSARHRAKTGPGPRGRPSVTLERPNTLSFARPGVGGSPPFFQPLNGTVNGGSPRRLFRPPFRGRGGLAPFKCFWPPKESIFPHPFFPHTPFPEFTQADPESPQPPIASVGTLSNGRAWRATLQENGAAPPLPSGAIHQKFFFSVVCPGEAVFSSCSFLCSVFLSGCSVFPCSGLSLSGCRWLSLRSSHFLPFFRPPPPPCPFRSLRNFLCWRPMGAVTRNGGVQGQRNLLRPLKQDRGSKSPPRKNQAPTRAQHLGPGRRGLQTPPCPAPVLFPSDRPNALSAAQMPTAPETAVARLAGFDVAVVVRRFCFQPKPPPHGPPPAAPAPPLCPK